MDKATAVARITETENLTGDLEDTDATWLIDWGVAQVDTLGLSNKDDLDASDQLNQLMAVMRALGQIGGTYADRPTALLVSDLRGFFARYALAFGQPNRVSEADFSAIAARLMTLAPRAAMQSLISTANGQTQSGANHA